MSSNKHKKGDRIQARWSGSNTYYDAKIVDVLSKAYKVQFDDGSLSTVKFSDVKELPPSKESTSKRTTRSRSRSGGRAARTQSRSPSRRTPERKAKEIAKFVALKVEKKTPSKAEKKKTDDTSNYNSIKKDETDSAVKSSLKREKIGSTKEESKESFSKTITNSYIFKEANVVVSDLSSAHYRASRLAALRALETTKPLSDSDTEPAKRNAVPASEAKYSDDEEEEEEEVTPKPKTRRSLQILYFFGTVLRIILMPTSLLFLIFSCTKKQCTVLDTPQFYSKWRDFFNAVFIPLCSVIAFHLSQSILALIPLGRKVTGFPFDAKKITLEYRLNGFLCLIFSVLGFLIPAYLGIYMNWGYDKFRAIGLSCAIYSVIFSLILHVISTVKGDGVVQSKVPVLGNFYNGVYINPVLFGKVDIKTSFIRAGLIGSVLINLSILLKLFLMKGYITIPLASTAGMQIFFVFDLLFREEKLLSTATYTSDTIGYGFIMTNAFLIPIGLTLQNIYLFIFEAKSSTIPLWGSAAILCLFLTGYYIYLTSSNLKHNFRRNPFSSSLADVVSIPTSQKKRLIASGLWGVIRHPNYLGLLIMAVAWTLPCGFSHFIPYGPLIMLFIALIFRSYRVEADCKEKYGPAWSNYTDKVRSRLIPYIF